MFFNPNKRYLKTRGRGFTLVEVLVSIAILGILTALALPSFTTTIRRYRAVAIRDDLIASINFAHSEAIRRGLPVTVAKVPCGAAIAGDWRCGWQVIDNALNVLQQSTVNASFAVTNTDAPLKDNFIVNQWGQVNGGAKFQIAPIIAGVVTTSDTSTNALCLGAGGVNTKIEGSTACP